MNADVLLHVSLKESWFVGNTEEIGEQIFLIVLLMAYP